MLFHLFAAFLPKLTTGLEMLRGEVWWLEFDLAVGSEIHQTRLAVLSCSPPPKKTTQKGEFRQKT